MPHTCLLTHLWYQMPTFWSSYLKKKVQFLLICRFFSYGKVTSLPCAVLWATEQLLGNPSYCPSCSPWHHLLVTLMFSTPIGLPFLESHMNGIVQRVLSLCISTAGVGSSPWVHVSFTSAVAPVNCSSYSCHCGAAPWLIYSFTS